MQRGFRVKHHHRGHWVLVLQAARWLTAALWNCSRLRNGNDSLVASHLRFRHCCACRAFRQRLPRKFRPDPPSRRASAQTRAVVRQEAEAVRPCNEPMGGKATSRCLLRCTQPRRSSVRHMSRRLMTQPEHRATLLSDLRTRTPWSELCRGNDTGRVEDRSVQLVGGSSGRATEDRSRSLDTPRDR